MNQKLFYAEHNCCRFTKEQYNLHVETLEGIVTEAGQTFKKERLLHRIQILPKKSESGFDSTQELLYFGNGERSRTILSGYPSYEVKKFIEDEKENMGKCIAIMLPSFEFE